MRRFHIAPFVLLLSVIGLLVPQAGHTQTPAGALSARNANYDIQVALDPRQKTLDGREVLTWRNETDAPATELWFHLYYNAWKNTQSTWLKEDSLRGARAKVRPEDWSYIDVSSVRVLPEAPFDAADLTSAKRFASPDDGNPEDQTVLIVPLPRPVGPKETIKVEVVFHSKIPRTFARTGYRGNYFFIAQWFPKVGVYQPDGKWNCHQFHAATEFFSDYGVYDVRMTVPRGYVLGATGVLKQKTENPEGTTTYEYFQEDVHDFAWTASERYLERTARFEEPGLPPVEMRLLLQPEHSSQAERHFAATRAALKHYGTWYGAYPYGHITIVDPAYDSGAGGMEYPTLFTAGSRWLNPEGGGSPEGVTVHEAGHQFWYGIVGNNEFEDAWLDEGFNTFSTARTMEAAFGENVYVRRYFRTFLPVLFRDIKLDRMIAGNRLDGYRNAIAQDAQSRPTYLYYPPVASTITYSKTALWLSTLERELGWETLQKILSTYFDRWKFKHPKPADFFAVANEVSGRDLTPFFDQVYRSSAIFDYAVQSVDSQPAAPRGYIDKDGGHIYSAPPAGDDAPPLYHSRIVLRRLGDGIWPVDVEVAFENGEKLRERWDGRERYQVYEYDGPSKIRYAIVDRERKLLLDVDYTNNSRLLEPRPEFAARKWASKWMVWFQDLLATFASFS